jgi:hypothetical protein
MEMFHNEQLLAMTHRENKLLSFGLQALILNIFEQKN